jgi:hypothetical protein
MELTSFYIIFFATALCFAVWPEETTVVLTAVSLKIQIYILNYKMKWMAWRLHREMTRLAAEAGLPAPGPFRFVNIWDRDKQS